MLPESLELPAEHAYDHPSLDHPFPGAAADVAAFVAAAFAFADFVEVGAAAAAAADSIAFAEQTTDSRPESGRGIAASVAFVVVASAAAAFQDSDVSTAAVAAFQGTVALRPFYRNPDSVDFAEVVVAAAAAVVETASSSAAAAAEVSIQVESSFLPAAVAFVAAEPSVGASAFPSASSFQLHSSSQVPSEVAAFVPPPDSAAAAAAEPPLPVDCIVPRIESLLRESSRSHYELPVEIVHVSAGLCSAPDSAGQADFVGSL